MLHLHGGGVCISRYECVAGVLHLHGGGGAEDEPFRAAVRDPVVLLPHLLPGLHPPVALRQAV